MVVDGNEPISERERYVTVTASSAGEATRLAQANARREFGPIENITILEPDATINTRDAPRHRAWINKANAANEWIPLGSADQWADPARGEAIDREQARRSYTPPETRGGLGGFLTGGGGGLFRGLPGGGTKVGPFTFGGDRVWSKSQDDWVARYNPQGLEWNEDLGRYGIDPRVSSRSVAPEQPGALDISGLPPVDIPVTGTQRAWEGIGDAKGGAQTNLTDSVTDNAEKTWMGGPDSQETEDERLKRIEAENQARARRWGEGTTYMPGGADPTITEFARYAPELEPRVRPDLTFLDFIRERGMGTSAESAGDFRMQLGGRAAPGVARRGAEAEAAFTGLGALAQAAQERQAGDPSFAIPMIPGYTPGMGFSDFLRGTGGGLRGEPDVGARSMDILRTLSAPVGGEYLQDLQEGTGDLSRQQIQSLVTSALRGRVSPFFIQRMLPSILPRLTRQYEEQAWRNEPGREGFVGYLTRRLPGLGGFGGLSPTNITP